MRLKVLTTGGGTIWIEVESTEWARVLEACVQGGAVLPFLRARDPQTGWVFVLNMAAVQQIGLDAG